MDLMTGLSAISQTLAITKEIRNIDDKIIVAEFKLRISDIVDKLLDAKQALQDAQERESSLLLEVQKLKTELVQRGRLQDADGLLFEVDDDGALQGEPYCNYCYVKDAKKYRMRFYPASAAVASLGYYAPSERALYECPNCKTGIRR